MKFNTTELRNTKFLLYIIIKKQFLTFIVTCSICYENVLGDLLLNKTDHVIAAITTTIFTTQKANRAQISI